MKESPVEDIDRLVDKLLADKTRTKFFAANEEFSPFHHSSSLGKTMVTEKIPIAGNAPISTIRKKSMEVTGLNFFNEKARPNSDGFDDGIASDDIDETP